MFRLLKVGDPAWRSFCGLLDCWPVLFVDEEEDTVTIGMGWKFCRRCGAELDDDLGWDCVRSGSFLENICQQEARTAI